MRRHIKNKVKCKPGCRVCAGGPCSPTCGYCMDFKRVSRPEPPTYAKKSLEDLWGRMTEKFNFGKAGIKSRGFYLNCISSGTNSVNKMRSECNIAWATAKEIIDALETDGMIRDVNKAAAVGYPKYELTEWGTKEHASFLTRNDNVSAPTIGKVEGTSAEVTKMHTVPEPPETTTVLVNHPDPGGSPGGVISQEEVPVDQSPLPEKPVTSIVENTSNDAPPHEDQYQKAYRDILVEKFGDQVTFKEVVERVNASL